MFGSMYHFYKEVLFSKEIFCFYRSHCRCHFSICTPVCIPVHCVVWRKKKSLYCKKKKKQRQLYSIGLISTISIALTREKFMYYCNLIFIYSIFYIHGYKITAHMQLPLVTFIRCLWHKIIEWFSVILLSERPNNIWLLLVNESFIELS